MYTHKLCVTFYYLCNANIKCEDMLPNAFEYKQKADNIIITLYGFFSVY